MIDETPQKINPPNRISLTIHNVETGHEIGIQLVLFDRQHETYNGPCPFCEGIVWAYKSIGTLECENPNCGFDAFLPMPELDHV